MNPFDLRGPQFLLFYAALTIVTMMVVAGTALSAGLSEDDARKLARIDLESLRLAARSFEKKRARR